MIEPQSLLTRLLEKLDSIESDMQDLIDASSIGTFQNDPDSMLYIVRPDHHWDEPSPEKRQVQLHLKPLFREWALKVDLLIQNAPKSMKKEIAALVLFFNRWIENQDDWDVASTIDANKATCESKAGEVRRLLGEFGSLGTERIVLVPDTNALIMSPDPTAYSQITENPKFTLIILPTVISELDTLKNNHSNPEFRAKVNSIIKRIKGFRGQGSLREGVTVNKTITVKTIGHEPQFKNTLEWLDPNNNDDRIIASVFELQVKSPSSVHILVTGDLNLQNKAELADLPWVERPTLPSA